MWCANCLHDGRQTAAVWRGQRIAVCDEHKAYHERLAALKPLSAVTRPIVKRTPDFRPL